MRHSATYYFLLVAVANAWLTWFFPQFTGMMAHQWETDLGGVPLPHVTDLLIRFPWWPAIFLVASVAGVALGVALRNRGTALLHGVIALLMIEGFTLFCVGIGHAIPYVKLVSPLK